MDPFAASLLGSIEPRLGTLGAAYQAARPFPHVVLDNFLPEALALEVEAAFPSGSDKLWWQYDNPLEKKLACNQLEKVAPIIRQTLEALNTPELCAILGRGAGIAGLVADPGLNGGGLHCIRPGGKLDVHIDYSIHPKLGLERRLNLIVYLNRDWQEAWGGHLELWDPAMGRCEKRVLPIFNRAVLFNTGDGSYHGHPEPLASPEPICRKSLALYYLSEPRPAVTARYKARFVKRPSDPDDPELEKLRLLRADPDRAAAIWRSPDGPSKPE